MKNVKSIIQYILTILIAGLPPAINASPQVWLKSVPPNVNSPTTIYPVAEAKRASTSSGDQLYSITIWYSWDNVNWSALYTNSSPDQVYGWDTAAGVAYLGSTGTIYFKATATDASNNTTTVGPKSTTINGTSSTGAAFLVGHNTFYDYGASWMYDSAESTQKIWWTSTATASHDALRYASGALGSTNGSVVFDRTSDTSDPCVIKYPVTYGGVTYSYVMYYTDLFGTATNGIGLAFSTNGTTWVDAGKIISSQSTGATWGAGLPSVVRLRTGGVGSATDKWVMINYDITQNGRTLWYRESSNGITWNSPTQITGHTPLYNQSGNGKWGIGPSASYYNGYWYMTYSAMPNNDEIYVYKFPASNIISGSWGSPIQTIPSSQFFYLKHSPDFMKDEDGYLYVNGTAKLLFSAQNGSSTDSGDIWESHIYFNSFSP